MSDRSQRKSGELSEDTPYLNYARESDIGKISGGWLPSAFIPIMTVGNCASLLGSAEVFLVPPLQYSVLVLFQILGVSITLCFGPIGLFIFRPSQWKRRMFRFCWWYCFLSVAALLAFAGLAS